MRRSLLRRNIADEMDEIPGGCQLQMPASRHRTVGRERALLDIGVPHRCRAANSARGGSTLPSLLTALPGVVL